MAVLVGALTAYAILAVTIFALCPRQTRAERRGHLARRTARADRRATAHPKPTRGAASAAIAVTDRRSGAKLESMEFDGSASGPHSPEGAEEAFLKSHRELEAAGTEHAFGTVSDARDYVFELCAWLAEHDERAVGRPPPQHVVESSDVMSNGQYDVAEREMRLRLLVKFSALHEIAHWLAPAGSARTQHFRPWRDAQLMLVAPFLGESYATELAAAYAAAESEAPGGVFECDG